VSVWIYLRHFLNLKILWAVLTEFKTVGPYELNFATQQYKCWISQLITFCLLASLQAVNLFWLFLILRILKNYLLNSVKQDERSDDEDDDEEVEASTKAANGSAALANGNGVSAATRRNVGAKDQAPEVLVNGVPVVEIPVANGKKHR
jgi:acyl-CoA-dependent ceramide synthase